MTVVGGLVPATDWSHRGGAAVMVEAGTVGVPVPVPPIEPAPPDPAPRVEPRRWRLVACDGLTGTPIVEFVTAQIGEVTLAQLGVGVMRHAISVAATDPGWALLARHRGITAAGSVPIHRLVETVEWRVWEDGVLVASGITDGPVDSGSVVDLRVSGGGGLLRDRYLGSGGTTDRLDGRGLWSTPSLGGWTIDGLDWRWNTTDPFRGHRSLQVRGGGHVYSPWGATFTSAAGRGRVQMFSPVVVRLGDTDAAVAVGVELRDATTGQLVPRGRLYDDGVSSTDGRESGWQQIDGDNRTPLGGGRWQARSVIAVLADDWIDIGQVTHRQNHVTGSFESRPVPLEDLVRAVIRKAQVSQSGGDLGVTVREHSASGARDGILWRDARDPAVSDALSSVLDRVDAPDAWFTPDRVLHLAKRAGRDRTDMVLNRDTVVAASVETDPAARFDELRAQTGYGAGPTRAVVAYDGPGVDGAPRRRALVQAPSELSYRSAGFWVEGHGEFVARQAVTVRAVVPGWYGRGVAVGDGVRVSLDIDGWRIDEAMRIGRITAQPAADTVTLDLGHDQKVSMS